MENKAICASDQIILPSNLVSVYPHFPHIPTKIEHMKNNITHIHLQCLLVQINSLFAVQLIQISLK